MFNRINAKLYISITGLVVLLVLAEIFLIHLIGAGTGIDASSLDINTDAGHFPRLLLIHIGIGLSALF